MRLDYTLDLTSALRTAQAPWSPARLFDGGAAGAVYSAQAGLFQDSAGTVAADAPGQAVARMNDLSGTGNHAAQIVADQRPTLGRHPARGLVNRLPNTTADGAAVGVLGAGGALPTGWEAVFAGGAGGTFEVVAVGNDYIDLRIDQTSTSGAPIIRPSTFTPTEQGEDWAFSMDLALVAGSLGGNGTPELSGTQRDNVASSLAALDFLDPVPITGTLRRHGGTTSITEPMATQMNPDFRVISNGAWDATFRLGLPQLERGTTTTAIQTARAGGYDVTEDGQRDVYYLQPDGVDDWLDMVTAFVPSGDYTLALSGYHALGDDGTRVFSSSGTGSSRFGFNASGNATFQVWADTISNRSQFSNILPESRRFVMVARSSAALQAAEGWLDGAAVSGGLDGAMQPIDGIDALFRGGGGYASGRFYGAVLIDSAVSDPERIRLQHYLSNLAGVSP